MPHHPLGTWHSLITRGAKLIQTECLEIPCGSRCTGRMGPDAQPLLTLLDCPVPWYRNLRLVPGWRFIILEARSMMTFVYFCMLHKFHKMWHTHDAAIACPPTPEVCTASRVRHRLANGPRSASVIDRHLTWLAIALQPMFLGFLRAERHRERWWVLCGGGNSKPILSFFPNMSIICWAFMVDSLSSLMRTNLIKHVQIFGDMHLAKDPGGPVTAVA